MTKFLNISTDTTLGGNAPSDELAVSQKAIKTYVDSNANNVVWVTYNSTPFADIRAAMQAGKIVLLKYTTNWNEYILRATNLIFGTTEYIYFTALDTYTHVAYARVSSAEAWIYGGQTNQSSISDLSTIRSGAAAGATAVQPGDLAAVATSGSYNDLSNKPTIPTVNNPTITITQGGVTKGSFTLNQASGDTIALDAGGGGSAWGNITGTLSNQTDLSNALSGKADIDASNFDATGKSTIAKIGNPSATYTNLTYGNPSNDFHVAPANGYVYIAATPSSQQPVGVVVADSTQTTNSGVQNNHIYQMFGRVPASNMSVLVPIQKGFTFKAADGGTAFSSIHYYRFIYAEGEI